MKNLLIIFLLIVSELTFGQNFNIERGNPFIRNFKPSEYHAHEQNFDITQDNNGIMYFANFEAVLIFDGVSWTKVPTSKGMRVLSIDVGDDGVVFVGGLYDFGFIEKNEYGEFSFTSLVDSSWAGEYIGEVFNVHTLNNHTYFITKNKMFVYYEGEIKVVEFQNELLESFEVNNELFLFFHRDLQNEKLIQNGLTKYQNGSFIRFSDNSIAQIVDVKTMFYLSEAETYIIGTESQGFFQMKDNIINTMEVDVNNFAKKNSLSCGDRITDDLYAIGTSTQGVLLVNSMGEIIQIIDKKSLLFDASINDLFIDHSNNVWVATNNGISLIELNNSLSLISNQSSGIEGKINKIFKFDERLFCATNNGLYFLNNVSFQKILNFDVACWDVQIFDNKLFVATPMGIYFLSGNSMVKTPISDFSFCLLKSKNQLYVGQNSKILILEENNNSLEVVDTILGIIGNVTKMEENSNGELYVEIPPGNIYKVSETNYSTTKMGYGEDFISLHINKFRGKIFFSSEKGVFEDIGKKDLSEFEFFNKLNEGKGLWIYDFFELDNKHFIFTDGSRKNITNMSINGDTSEIDQSIFLPINDFTVRTMFFDKEKSNIWLGGNDGLIVCNYGSDYEHKTEYKVSFSKIVNIKKDSLMTILNDEVKKIDFSENSIRFEYFTPYFPAKGEILYSYYLEGFDKDFSSWTNLSYKEFSNLPSSNYVFYVKAKDQFGNLIDEASFKFKILVPVYKRWWAILIYLIIIGLLLKLFIDNRLKKEEKERGKLEAIIKERTAEIEQSKAEIEAQRDVEFHHRKEIMSSIHYAKRIQQAVLPTQENLGKVLADKHFIFFKPQNIVSGDFFWMKQLKNFIVIVAADCTGHGVPGAFMSMLGTSFLNEIVTRRSLDSAAEVLERLRNKVKLSLHQEGKMNEQKDGMDIAIYFIDTETYELQYSGAYNPLYIIRENNRITAELKKRIKENPKKLKLFSDEISDVSHSLIELRANRQPIGIYIRELPFDNVSMKLEKGDCIYSFSDGYQDQFGGDVGEKYNSRRFKRFLLSIQDKSMEEQKRIVEQNFVKWKGDLEQIDDVLVIGLKIDFED